MAMFKKVEWKPIAHGSRSAKTRFAGLRLKQSFKLPQWVFIFAISFIFQVERLYLGFWSAKAESLSEKKCRRSQFT